MNGTDYAVAAYLITALLLWGYAGSLWYSGLRMRNTDANDAGPRSDMS